MNSASLANHKNRHWRSLLAIVAVLIQSGCSVFGIRSAEEASYIVLDDQDEFQLREYAGVVIVETTVNAGFDPPWTLPFLRRNEVMIDVGS